MMFAMTTTFEDVAVEIIIMNAITRGADFILLISLISRISLQADKTVDCSKFGGL